MRGHLDLNERALDGAVLTDQLADAVGDPDQDDRRGHEPVREARDRVGEEHATVSILEAVELVR